jgi:hypothetical protein
MENVCLFCGGNADEEEHYRYCCGRQGAREAEEPDYDGETYEPEHDRARLNAQTKRVWTVMQSGSWFSLREIAERTGDPEASVSARLRDLRKEKFGGHTVERIRAQDRSGLFFYRVVEPRQ